MPVVPTGEILAAAYRERYGVPAINIVNDLTLEAVLAAAVEERVAADRADLGQDRPVDRQPTCSTAMWTSMTAGIEVPVTLHLDHCPDRAVITECLELGWNSVLFDASQLPVEENQRQTIEVVAEARAVRRPRRGRDRVDHRRRGRHRLRRPRPARQTLDVVVRLHRDAPASTCSRRRSATRTASTSRRRRWTPSGSRDIVAAHRHPDRPARRQRPDRRAVPRPDRPGLRQGQHLHGAQGSRT